MKVAIAGTGNLSTYLVEELSSHGHDVVVLTRSHKSALTTPQRTTDYTVESLKSVLHDREALVSTVMDYNNPESSLPLHLTMLEAVQQSPKTTTFLPSEWTLNARDYPDQPMFMTEHTTKQLAALRAAKDVRWTIIANSWFMDYVNPESSRVLRNIGPMWPMDHASKMFTIYGPGTQTVDLVSVRDVARAVAVLIDSKEPWDEYTFLSGQKLTWNELFEIIKSRDPEWKKVNKSLAQTLEGLKESKSWEEQLLAQFELLSYSGGSELPKKDVDEARKKFFDGKVKFRTVDELVEDAKKRPNEAV